MKRFAIRTALIFILAFVLVFLASSFFYSLITNSYFETKASESLIYINKKLAYAIDSSLTYDYQKLVEEIDSYEGNDKVEFLKTNKNSLYLNNTTYSGFGIAYENYFMIDNIKYDFNLEFIASSYSQNQIAFYNFSKVFVNSTDNNLYCIFRIDDIIAFFKADEYLDPFFVDGEKAIDNYYFIIGQDGYVNYQEDENSLKDKLFDHYLRGNNPEFIIENIIDDFYNSRSNIQKLKIFNEESFLSYTPILEGYTGMKMYVVQSVAYSVIVGSTADLRTTLVILFVVFLLIISTIIIIIYFVLRSKYDDIELSRLIHYYSKPFLLRINKKGRILFSNQTYKNNVKEYYRFKNVFDLRLEKEDSEILSKIKKQIAFTAVFKNKKDHMTYVRFIPLKSGSGFYLLGENITQREQENIYNRHLALYNKVTNLPNLNYLTIKLKELFENSNKIKLKNSLVSINVVGFKNINNLFGNKIGDETLQKFSTIIQDTLLGFETTVFNTESDNFVVLFENLDDYSLVTLWANKLLDFLKKPIEIEKNSLNLEVKIGIFNIETSKYDNLNATASYENSVIALKKAKYSRSTNLIVYDIGLGQFITREQIMENDLVKAIKENEFMMFLQPQYNNASGKIVGCEALIRWNNPKYRMESPAHFIELAEQNNLIIEIGHFVIEETFRIAKQIENYGIEVSINVSPVQILQAGFVTEMTKAFDKYQLRKHAISIEITETFLMTTFDVIIEKLKLLRNYGFNIHLDDFGTGYSSMLYLKDLPIDTIKIDKEFISNILTDRYARAIVSKIIALAKSLDLSIIAEGVEDEKQNQFLIKNGCNVIQGHLISKAVSVDEAIRLLEEYNVKKTK